MIEYLSDLRLFHSISRTLNFRAAGEQLGYSPAVVTSRMQRLEAVTGKQLFIRSTRHVKLTEDGQALLPLAEQMLELAERLAYDRRTEKDAAIVSGHVRISAPHSLARLYLEAPITELLVQNPALTIELVLDDGLTQLVKEGIDISFRVSGGTEHGYDAYTVMPDQRVLMAAPSYLDQYGYPDSPQALQHHRCLSYVNNRHWKLVRAGDETTVTIQPSVSCNTGDALRRLALRGAGITFKSDWSVREELSAGDLIRVLPEYTVGHTAEVKALLPHQDFTPARVTAVLNAIRDHVTASA